MRASEEMPFSAARTFIASRISRDTALLPGQVGLLDVGVLDLEQALVGAQRHGPIVGGDDLAPPGDPVVLRRRQRDLCGSPDEAG